MLFRQRESFHVHDSSKKCVTVYANGNFNNGKTVYIEPEWTLRDFLLAASQRLDTGWIASRLFNSDGAEVDDCMMLEDDGIAFVSNGQDFTSPIVSNGGGVDEGFGDTSIPPVVSGYLVGTLLGRGGFGEVRLGTHQLTNERTALKFLKKSEIISMGAAERTMTEIQCLMALKHNNIIRLFQHVEAPSHYVLIFELMEGGDLWNYLKRQPASRPPADSGTSSPSASGAAGLLAGGGLAAAPVSSMGGHPAMALSEDDARSVFQQIVSGIAYAHNQHICHRDLKLENILLKSKNLDSVKIADFGLSAFYRPGATLRTNCGTLSFLAPEVFKGTSNAGPPLDVWALGVILFALLCGRLPFEGSDLSYKERPRTPVIRTRIMKGQYKIDESLSPEVKDLVRRMLKVDPLERASVPEVLNHFWMRSVGSNINNSGGSNSSSSSSAASGARDSGDGRRDSKHGAPTPTGSHVLGSVGKQPPAGPPGSLFPKVPSASGANLVGGSETSSSPTPSRPSSPPGSLISSHRTRSYSDTGFGLSEETKSLNLPSTVDESDSMGPPPFNPHSPISIGAGGDVVDQFKLVPLRRRATTASAHETKSLFNKSGDTASAGGAQYGSGPHRLLAVGEMKDRHTMLAHDAILSVSSSSTALPNRTESRKSFSSNSNSGAYSNNGVDFNGHVATGSGYGAGTSGASAVSPPTPLASLSPRPSNKRHGSNAIINAANASLLSTSVTSGGGGGGAGAASRKNSSATDSAPSRSSYK